MKLGLKGGLKIVLNLVDAAGIINKNFPGYQILKQVPYKDIFVFLLAPPEPDEPPTFFKVDKNTGKFTDFSPWNEPDPESLEKALLA